MTFTEAVFVFFSSLLMSVSSSAVMSRRLDQATAWLRFPEGLVVLIAALGADTPEISSALTGMMSGNHDLGLGVIFGSNIFNLAALLGASAVVAGQIRIGPAGVLLNGCVALWISGVIAAQLAGLLPPSLSGILIGIAVVPYVGVPAGAARARGTFRRLEDSDRYLGARATDRDTQLDNGNELGKERPRVRYRRRGVQQQ
jgi:Ca2+/Na+ antiporter